MLDTLVILQCCGVFFSTHAGFQQGFCSKWIMRLCYKGISLVFIQDGGWRRKTGVVPLSEILTCLPGNHHCVSNNFFLALPYAIRKDLGEKALFNANLLRIESSVLSKCKSVVYTDARKCKIRNECVDFLSSNCISS